MHPRVKRRVVAALGLASLLACPLIPRAWLALDPDLRAIVAAIEVRRGEATHDPWGREWIPEQGRMWAYRIWSAGPDGVFHNGQGDDLDLGWRSSRSFSPHAEEASALSFLECRLPLPWRRPWLVCAGAWLLAGALLACDRLGHRTQRPFLRRWLAIAGGGCTGVAAWLLARGVLVGPLRWQPWDGQGQLRPRLQLELPALLQPSSALCAVAIGVGVSALLWVRSRPEEGGR